MNINALKAAMQKKAGAGGKSKANEKHNASMVAKVMKKKAAAC